MLSPHDIACVICGSSVGRVDSLPSVLAIARAVGKSTTKELPLLAGTNPGRIWHVRCGSPTWNANPTTEGRVRANAQALTTNGVSWEAKEGPAWGKAAPATGKASGPTPAEVKALADLRAENLRLKAEAAGLATPTRSVAPDLGKAMLAERERLMAELEKLRAEQARLKAEVEAEVGPSPAEVKAKASPAPVVAPPPAPKAAPVVTAPPVVAPAPVVKPTPAVDTSGMCWRDRRLAELAAKAAPVQATPAVAPPVLPPPAPPAPVQPPPVVVPPAPVAPPVMVQPVAPVQAMPVHGAPVRIPVDRATYAALLRAMELPADEMITMAMDRAPIRLGSTVGPVVVELVLS